MDFNFDKLSEIFKKQDLGNFRKANGESANVEDTIVFEMQDGEYQIDEELLSRDGFIKALKAQNTKEKALTEEQLGLIYDTISTMDDEDGMSEKELKYLASLGNDTDKYDSEGNTINEFDIKEFLDNVEDVLNDDALCCDDDCCPEDCSCQDVPRETITSVLKDDDRILTDDDGNKYVNVEPWSNDEDNNNCLSRIIQNSYDLEAMGIEPDSEEYYALEEAVMNANPSIYGTEEGGWRQEVGGTGRHNAVLYTGDKIILSDFEYERPCPCVEDPEPVKTTTTNPSPNP